MSIYSSIVEKSGKGLNQIAILIDPDNITDDGLLTVIDKAIFAKIDLFLIGGSLMVASNLEECIQTIKNNCDIPVVLFPGSPLQVSPLADGILFLSLISGRNAEYLIGNHVIAAPYIKATNLEVIPSGYMLIDGGMPTTASYMSVSNPIPYDKPQIAISTAIAGELLGLKLIYMDAGSGSKNTVNPEMVALVKKNINVPLIVGGGIDTVEKASALCNAGADLIVVGNAVEKDHSFIGKISAAVKQKSNEAYSHFQSR